MGYSNTGRPVFYVSVLQWLKSIGKLTSEGTATDGAVLSDKGRLDIVDITSPGQMEWYSGNHNTVKWVVVYKNKLGPFNQVMPGSKNFAMVLGHDLTVANGVEDYLISKEHINTGFDPTMDSDNWLSHYGRVNYEQYIENPGPEQKIFKYSDYNGWSLATGNSGAGCDSNLMGLTMEIQTNSGVENSRKIKAYLYGTYFNVPHSPDLKLTMTREMDGVKRIRTKGGADLVNYRYTKQPSWGVASPWELYGEALSNKKLARNGRRIWDLSFTYFQSDIFPEISNSNWFEAYDNGTPYTSTDLDKTLIAGDNFYSQVIHKTAGGQLSFVFQPVKTYYNDMAICKFDQKSFQFKKISNTIYKIKLKIKEVW